MQYLAPFLFVLSLTHDPGLLAELVELLEEEPALVVGELAEA